MRRVTVALGAVALIGTLTGCGASGNEVLRRSSGPDAGGVTPSSTAPPAATDDPGKLTGRLYRADLLITSDKTLSPELIENVGKTRHVERVEPLSLGSMSVEGRTLQIAAVDPASYRRFTVSTTAQADEVWARVASGEVAVDVNVPKDVIGEGDLLSLGDSEDAEKVHVGAYAPLTKSFSAVVNFKRGEQLGLPKNNALLVSTGIWTPSAVKKDIGKVLGDAAAMTILAQEFKNNFQQALLTDASVSSAVGSFRYSNGPDGTIRPDAKWVATYIRTETVPILGSVTCNKAVFPQLRAALGEVVKLGLEKEIHPGEYAGCYYPRYIGRSPANGLSLHSWGIALDLNVPGNQRGTVGEMDRRVVAVFKKWGFAWGGDWNYTDPMHFEMIRVVEVK